MASNEMARKMNDMPKQYRIPKKAEYHNIKAQATYDWENVKQLSDVLASSRTHEGAWRKLGLRPSTSEVAIAVLESRGIPANEVNIVVQQMQLEGGKDAAEKEAGRQIQISRMDARNVYTLEREEQTWLVQDNVEELEIAKFTFSMEDLERDVQEHVQEVLALSDKVWEVSRNKVVIRSSLESKGSRRLVGSKKVIEPHSSTWIDYQDNYVSTNHPLYKSRPWQSQTEALVEARVAIDKEATMKRKDLESLQCPSSDDEEDFVRDSRAEKSLAWKIDQLDRQLNGLTFAAEANAAATYTARMKAPPLSAYTVGGTRKEEMDKEGGRLPWATLRISACPSGTNSTRGVMSHTGAYCPEKDATWNHFDANNCPVPDLAGREDASGSSMFLLGSTPVKRGLNPEDSRSGSFVSERGSIMSPARKNSPGKGRMPSVQQWREADRLEVRLESEAVKPLGGKWLAKSLQDASKGWAGFNEIVPRMKKVKTLRSTASSIDSALSVSTSPRGRFRRPGAKLSTELASFTKVSLELAKASGDPGDGRLMSPLRGGGNYSRPKDRDLTFGRWSEAVSWASRGELVGADTPVGRMLLEVGGKSLRIINDGDKIGLNTPRYTPIFVCVSVEELPGVLARVAEGREADLVLLGHGLGRSEVAKKMARRRLRRRKDERDELRGKWGIGAGADILKVRDELFGWGGSSQGGKDGLMRQDVVLDDVVRGVLLSGMTALEEREALAQIQAKIASMRVKLLQIGNVLEDGQISLWDTEGEVTVCSLDRTLFDGHWKEVGGPLDAPTKCRVGGRWAGTVCAILARAGFPGEVVPEPLRCDGFAAEELAWRSATWLISESQGGIIETQVVTTHRVELERVLAEMVHIARSYLAMSPLGDGGTGGGAIDYSMGAREAMEFKIVTGSEGQEIRCMPGVGELCVLHVGPRGLGGHGDALSGASAIIARQHNPVRARSAEVPKRPEDLFQANGWFLTYGTVEQQPFHVELLKRCGVDLSLLVLHGTRRKMESGISEWGMWEPGKELTTAEEVRKERLGDPAAAPKLRPRTVSSMMREPLHWLGRP